MSRYSRNRVGLYKNADERSSIGESHMEKALINLNRQQQIAATVRTAYDRPLMETIHMLIDDDSYNKLHAVKDLIKTAGSSRDYPLQDVRFFVEFQHADIPAFEKAVVQTDRIAPLLTFLHELATVHWAYEEVRGVLKWLNRNATPGAIRYYWPSAMKLTETSPIWAELGSVPTRYTTPDGIGDWLQNLKDAAATVTGMLLLPNDVPPRPKNQMWVTFPSKNIRVGEGAGYNTDAVTYYI